eukprot:953393-Rhodomonas_salina.1
MMMRSQKHSKGVCLKHHIEDQERRLTLLKSKLKAGPDDRQKKKDLEAARRAAALSDPPSDESYDSHED